jgi:hypothetical protein
MRFLRKLFAPKEVRTALAVLEEADYTFDTEAFRLVRSEIERTILARPADFAKAVQSEGIPPRQCVYHAISNITARHLTSGRYHVYRGVLNTLGPGPDLLRLFYAALDELVRIGAENADSARKQKASIREEMKSVG